MSFEDCIERQKAYKSLRHELVESEYSGTLRSNENAAGTLGLGNFSCKISGRSSAEECLEVGGEKGGEGEGDGEKEYFRFPGPTLMGSGEGGVGGEDVGEIELFSNFLFTSIVAKSHKCVLSLSCCLPFEKYVVFLGNAKERLFSREFLFV